MKPLEIRELTLNELQLKLKELSKELLNVKFQHASNQLDNPMKVPHLKKDIARVKTIIKEKGLENKEGMKHG